MGVIPPFSRSTSPPFSKIPAFLYIKDAPTFHRFIRKTKVLNNSCNQFVYNFYPQSILVLEECLRKWWKRKLLETVTYVAIKERLVCIITIETVMCILHCRKYHLHNCNKNSHLHNYNKNCQQQKQQKQITTETVTCITAAERSTNIPVTKSTTSKPT